MEFELEELNDELEELNIELRNIKDINLLGKEITHKKFGNGRVVHQNGYNVTIQFNSEEKNLQAPFIFANNIAECNDKEVKEILSKIYKIQENIKLVESQIMIKEKEIKLNKQKNKELNVNLFAVTTGISYEYILQTKIYCCKANRCKKICDYLGLYKDKSIIKIAKIIKIIEAEHINDKLVTQLVKGSTITDDDIEMIEEYINKGFNLFGGDIGKQKHKYFIVDKFYDTDYKKISNGGLMEHKYFDLYDKLDEEKMPDIEILADRLQEIEWE